MWDKNLEIRILMTNSNYDKTNGDKTEVLLYYEQVTELIQDMLLSKKLNIKGIYLWNLLFYFKKMQ